MSNGKAALGGLDGNLAAALGYPIGIIAIISLIIEKDNRFVKFHAWQAVFLFAIYIVLMIVLGIIIGVLSAVMGVAAGDAGATVVWGLGALMWSLFPLVFLIALIVSAVKAYGGAEFKLPVIGNLASNMANK